MNILIEVGSKVEFDELPDTLDFGTEGTVSSISGEMVTVLVPGWGYVDFDLAGSSWSYCGEFKRDSAFVEDCWCKHWAGSISKKECPCRRK